MEECKKYILKTIDDSETLDLEIEMKHVLPLFGDTGTNIRKRHHEAHMGFGSETFISETREL